MQDKCRLTWSGEKEKNEMIKNIMKRQVFSYSWVFERFLFCFIFEKTSTSLPMLFVHIENSSSETLRSSRLQMFFKISVLKNFSSLFFIKKEIPTKVFSCEYCEIFKNSFLVKHFLFIILWCDDIILWAQNWHVFISLVLLLCFPS